VYVIGGFRKASVCGLFECRCPRRVVFSHAAIMQGQAFVAMHAYRFMCTDQEITSLGVDVGAPLHTDVICFALARYGWANVRPIDAAAR